MRSPLHWSIQARMQERIAAAAPPAQRRVFARAGMERLQVQPISRVQAIQRGGRAGRTAPGECFRLYTKRHFDHEMRDVSPPEILRTPLAAAVLHLKSLPAALGIDVLRFDFVDAPPRGALEEALRQLHLLGAIDAGAILTNEFSKCRQT